MSESINPQPVQNRNWSKMEEVQSYSCSQSHFCSTVRASSLRLTMKTLSVLKHVALGLYVLSPLTAYIRITDDSGNVAALQDQDKTHDSQYFSIIHRDGEASEDKALALIDLVDNEPEVLVKRTRVRVFTVAKLLKGARY